ncbi:MAG TPA: hypothetical protein VD994_06090 [Prosthecobacter sp.]|nr:hypothetical protein [Prosthecobacter sp.]
MSAAVESVTELARLPGTRNWARPPAGRVFLPSFLAGMLAAIVVGSLYDIRPLGYITAGGTLLLMLAVRLVRMEVRVFDERDEGPWLMKATCFWSGLVIRTRTHARADVQVATRYRESGMTSSGTAYGEKYWQVVETRDGRDFFSPWEVFLFGRKRLVRLMEETL